MTRRITLVAADEPAENAAVVAGRFLHDAPGGGARCRLLAAEDASHVPFAEAPDWDEDDCRAGTLIIGRAEEISGEARALERDLEDLDRRLHQCRRVSKRLGLTGI